MDIYCQHCNAAWDVVYIGSHMDEDEKEGDAERFKKGEGCPACLWGTVGEPDNSLQSMAMGALAELMGDDIDGMASMMDDLEYAGMLGDPYEDE